jgi:hypothetical protein
MKLTPLLLILLIPLVAADNNSNCLYDEACPFGFVCENQTCHGLICGPQNVLSNEGHSCQPKPAEPEKISEGTIALIVLGIGGVAWFLYGNHKQNRKF